MKFNNGWKLFVGLILVILAVMVNLQGELSVISISEPWQSIFFGILLIGAFWGILSQKEYAKDIGLMALILVVIYYFGGRLPLTAISNLVPESVLRVISLVLIVVGAFFIASSKEMFKRKKK